MLLREKVDELVLLREDNNNLELFIKNNAEDLDQSEFDLLLKRYFSNIDKIQSIYFFLDKVNSELEVNVGKEKVSVSVALVIKKHLYKKINFLDSIVGSIDYDNIMSILSIREELRKEYDSINSIVSYNDWSVSIDD
jgi:16S rRNA G527 N7-methylase RsmG